MPKFTVLVSREIEVELDPSKFTEEFMVEFRKSFYPFYDLEDHAMHLAQLHARELFDGNDFVEGYGEAEDAGIKVRLIDGWEEVTGD